MTTALLASEDSQQYPRLFRRFVLRCRLWLHSYILYGRWFSFVTTVAVIMGISFSYHSVPSMDKTAEGQLQLWRITAWLFFLLGFFGLHAFKAAGRLVGWLILSAINSGRLAKNHMVKAPKSETNFENEAGILYVELSDADLHLINITVREDGNKDGKFGELVTNHHTMWVKQCTDQDKTECVVHSSLSALSWSVRCFNPLGMMSR